VIPVEEVLEPSKEEEKLPKTNLITNKEAESSICGNVESVEVQIATTSEEHVGECEGPSEKCESLEKVPETLESNQLSNEENNEKFEMIDASMCCEENTDTSTTLDQQTNTTSAENPESREANQERIIAIEVNSNGQEEVIGSPDINESASIPSEPQVTNPPFSVNIPVKQEQPKDISQENTIESNATSNETESVDQDEGTKIEHSRDETMQCNVEKEIVECEEGAKIERTITSEQQIIRETKKQTTVSETVEQLTQEELLERFPELRGSILNETNESSKSEVVEGGKGTFEDPKTITASQEDSKVTSSTCPEDKDATMITITSSSLTKQTMQASSSSTSKEPTEDITKGPSPPARKRQAPNIPEKKSPDIEASTKEHSKAVPNVVNVPINVEIPSNESESTLKNPVSPPKPVAETKPPETARSTAPPAGPVNQQQGICCTIL